MRNLNRLLVALVLAFSVSTVYAAPSKLYEDVPKKHWAYKAVEELSKKGLLVGFPDGTFKGNKTINRYTFAVIVNRMLERYGKLPAEKNNMNVEDVKALEDLVSEFIGDMESISNEMKAIKTDVSKVESKVAKVESDVEQLKSNVEDLGKRSPIIENKVEKVEKKGSINVYGDILAQSIDYMKTGKNLADFQNMKVRIGFKAQPTDKVEADFRYVACDKDMDSNNDEVGRMTTDGHGHDYNGTSKSTFGAVRVDNKVEVAKVKVKNLLKDGDYVQVGRDFISNGHGMVINDYSDSVTYKSKAGDISLSASAIFADYDNGAIKDKKGEPIYNVNLEADVKGGNIYAGLYQQNTRSYYDVTRDADGNIIASTLKHKDRLRQIAEIGSSGNLKKDGKIKYDIAMVGSHNERKNIGAGGKKDKADGYLGHAAITLEPNSKLRMKAAYTTADEGFDGILSLDKNQGSIDGKQTPFDDIAKFQNLLGGMMNDKFYNTSDFKLQLEYALANNQTIRVAYDMVKENDNSVKTDYTVGGALQNNWNMTNQSGKADDGLNKLDAAIATLEYRYQFDSSSRISFGVSSADKSECRNSSNKKVKDERLFWTELHSRF